MRGESIRSYYLIPLLCLLFVLVDSVLESHANQIVADVDHGKEVIKMVAPAAVSVCLLFSAVNLVLCCT